MLRAFDKICYCSYERHFLTSVLGHRTSGGGGKSAAAAAAASRHVPWDV
jgi:hypothetical protein